MIEELRMDNFKGFSAPQGIVRGGVLQGGGIIRFGKLSLIIGPNASGKSNIRDGLRFIHGISRGYSLAEIIGEKYGEGGEPQWKGIRGGVRETVTRNGNSNDTKFKIVLKSKLAEGDGGGTATYSITVDVGSKAKPPVVERESLHLSTEAGELFKTGPAQGRDQASVFVLRTHADQPPGPSFWL